MKRFLFILLSLLTILNGNAVYGYPIDATPATGIQRLEGYRQAQINRQYGRLLPKGARLCSCHQ